MSTRRAQVLIGGIVGVLLLVGAVVAAITVEIPYYEFRPGSARPAGPQVQVEGAETFPLESDISFTTVSLRKSTVATWLLARFDSDVDVFEERLVRGDRSESENRQFNLQLMDTSKQDAIRIALLQLGYEVPITITGVVVVATVEGSAADGNLQVGDTIVAVDGEALQSSTDLSRLLDPKRPGDSVLLGVESPDRTARDVELVLGAAPDEPDRAFIGVNLQPREPNYEFPFAVDIDSANVGGPSAGLAFTLAVLDVLTPGDLTGGNQVAVTGTIEPDGTVGAVGGVRQKTAVVVDEGYDVFLVPSAEFEEISERAGGRVRVIPVDTLGEALDALSSLGGSGLGTAPPE